jgi:glucose-6-phosphate isomerase
LYGRCISYHRREAREFSVPRLSSLHPRVLAAVAVLALSTGCGPFGYLKKVATDASKAVAEAEAAEAEKYAPYEYWGAVAYLEQAKVLMGYSEYERSFDFGKRAEQLAGEAKVKAQRVKKGESVVRDEDIAAPTDMVDSEGNKIESVDEGLKKQKEADAEGEAKGDGKKSKGKSGGGAP